MIKTTLLALCALLLLTGARCTSSQKHFLISSEKSILKASDQVDTKRNPKLYISVQATDDLFSYTPAQSHILSLQFNVQTTKVSPLKNLSDFSGLLPQHSRLIKNENQIDHLFVEGYVTAIRSKGTTATLPPGKHWASFIRVINPFGKSAQEAQPFLYYGVIKGEKDSLLLLYGDQIHQVQSNLFQEQTNAFLSFPRQQMGASLDSKISIQHIVTMTQSFDRAYGGLGLYYVLGSYMVRKRLFQELFNINLELFAFYDMIQDEVSFSDPLTIGSETYSKDYIKKAGQIHSSSDRFSKGRSIPFYMHYTDDSAFEQHQNTVEDQNELGLSFIGPICNKRTSQSFYDKPFHTMMLRPAFNTQGRHRLSFQYLLDAHENLHMLGALHEDEERHAENGSLMQPELNIATTHWKMDLANTQRIATNLEKMKNPSGATNPHGFCPE